MSLLTEQLSSAAQNRIATQIAFFQAFSQSAFGGLEKLITLNLSMAKQSMDNANQITRELMAVTEPQELLQFGRAHSQPPFEKLMSYSRELATISLDTRAGIWQAVNPGSLPVSTVISPVSVLVDMEKNRNTASKATQPKPSQAVESPKQLPLLAESELKVLKTAKPVAKAKPVVKAEPQIAAKVVVTNKLQKEKPLKTDVKKIVAKTPATEKKALPVKTAKPVTTVKPALVTPPTAPLATPVATEATAPRKTAVVIQAAAVTPVNKNPTTASKAADNKKTTITNDTEEKKSAVKFPFPAASKSKAGTPAFPKAGGKPAYKAKSSAATGAKKPVRQ